MRTSTWVIGVFAVLFTVWTVWLSGVLSGVSWVETGKFWREIGSFLTEVGRALTYQDGQETQQPAAQPEQPRMVKMVLSGPEVAKRISRPKSKDVVNIHWAFKHGGAEIICRGAEGSNPLAVIDGDCSTFWTAGRSGETYWILDLGSVKTFRMERWDLIAASPWWYSIDGENWNWWGEYWGNQVDCKGTPMLFTDEYETVTARYIRFFAFYPEEAPPAAPFFICEIKLYRD